MADTDKRRAPRDKHDSVIEIFDAEGKLAVTGRLVDFSATGASFSLKNSIVIPEKFRARLRFLDKGVLEAEARVVRSSREQNSTRYGIKFENLKNIYPTGELKGPRQ